MDIVSVIIPVFNTEKYLEQCINSILNQSYKYIDLILINDGSTDKSGAICDTYAKKDLRVRVFHKKNEGVSVARNLGITNAIGTYLMFVDSDDWLEKFAIKILVDHIKVNDTDACFCDRFIVEGKIQKKGTEINDGNYNAKTILEKHLNCQFISSSCLSLVKKDKIDKCFFDTEIHTFEDWEYNFKVLSKLDTATKCSEAYYNYRSVVGSASRSALDEKKLTALLIPNKVKVYISNNDLRIENNGIYLSFYILSMLLMVLVKSEYKKKESKILKKFAQKHFFAIVFLKNIGFRHRLYIITCTVSMRLFYVILNRKRHKKI